MCWVQLLEWWSRSIQVTWTYTFWIPVSIVRISWVPASSKSGLQNNH
jgi:hypothetical protein